MEITFFARSIDILYLQTLNSNRLNQENIILTKIN